MQRHTSALRETLQTVRHHLRAQLAEPFPLQAQLYNAVRAIRQINDRAGKCLIERSIGVAESRDTGQTSEGFVEGVADGDAAILGGVVVVN